MINKIVFTICAIILLGGFAVGYDYYFGDRGAVVEIDKTFSSALQSQILSAYPEITNLRSDGRTTLIECGSLSEYNCRRLGQKIEAILTKICLDRNGIVSIEVNAQGNIVRTVGDTSCLR